jgi:murein DD-endopeptidase MepM/ murein hydrolase activator NlpD
LAARRRLPGILLALSLSGCASGGARGPLPPGTLVGGCGPARGLRPLYDLPFARGESFELTQGNCGNASHDGRFRYSFDFRMPPGTPVLAARDGRVTNVRDDRPDGTRRVGDENFVIVLHDGGQYSRYIHLQRHSARVAKGEKVAAGDTIGLSGNSGQSMFPHLHFDVAKDCRQRCETIPSAFRNAEPPIPDAREQVRALE